MIKKTEINFNPAKRGYVQVCTVDRSLPKEVYSSILCKQQKNKVVANKITNDVAHFMGLNYSRTHDRPNFTHMYGQYGTEANFPEDGGPFFTAEKTDTFDDLTPANVSIQAYPILLRDVQTKEGQSTFANNVVTFISSFDQHTGNVYIGAGLVSELSNGDKLLLGHIALNGSLLPANKKLLVGWTWEFGN